MTDPVNQKQIGVEAIGNTKDYPHVDKSIK
jgi:hypothetical protein